MIRQNKDEKRQACSTKKQACPFCGVTGIIYSQCTWAVESCESDSSACSLTNPSLRRRIAALS